MNWPEWWSWELVLSRHLLRRMVEREFNEIEIRTMVNDAAGVTYESDTGHWCVETSHQGEPWEVIVEPVPHRRALVVITAYRVD